MTTEQVQHFFQGYARAFERLDGDAVADAWHLPSGIADGQGGQARLSWWMDDGPMRANHRALCDHYRAAGLARVDFTVAAHEPMGDHHDFVRVHWRLRRADGSLIQAFGTGYHLARTADGPRVLLCTAYQENLKEMTPDAAA